MRRKMFAGCQASLLQQGLPDEGENLSPVKELLAAAADPTLSQDWPRHKPLCKPSEELPLNARETVAAVSAKKRTSALEHAPASRDKCAREWKIRAEPGPDHFVELDLEDIIGQPGYGTLRVDSHTIAPEDLRALRDEWELMLRQYAKNMAKELAGHATTGDDESSGGGVDAVSG